MTSIIESLKDFFNQGWIGAVFGVIGIVIGVIGIVIAFRFSVRQKLSYIPSSIQLTGLNSRFSPDLKISFRGRELELVTKSVVTFWNSGTATIEGSKIVSTSPLRIVTSQESEILDAAVSTATRGANKFTVKLRDGLPNELECSFDYLDRGDGVIVSMLHTGSWRVNVVGDIQGMPSGPTEANTPFKNRYDPLFWLFAAVTLCGIGALILYAIFKSWPNSSMVEKLFLLTYDVILFIMAGLLFFVNKPFRQQPPKALREWETSHANHGSV